MSGGVIVPPESYDDTAFRDEVREALDAMLALFTELAATGEPPSAEHRAYVAQLIGRLGPCHQPERKESPREPAAMQEFDRLVRAASGREPGETHG